MMSEALLKVMTLHSVLLSPNRSSVIAIMFVKCKLSDFFKPEKLQSKLHRSSGIVSHFLLVINLDCEIFSPAKRSFYNALFANHDIDLPLLRTTHTS